MSFLKLEIVLFWIFINFLIYIYSNRLVDIICEKINESGDSDQQSNQGNNATNSGPNYRGGPSSGATKLTDSASNPSQSCQC